VDNVRGPADSAWCRTAEGITLKVDLPDGTEALVTLPGGHHVLGCHRHTNAQTRISALPAPMRTYRESTKQHFATKGKRL
jgi:hypothetical protein